MAVPVIYKKSALIKPANKKVSLIGLSFVPLFVAILIFILPAKAAVQKQYKFRISNQSSFLRKNEIITIHRKLFSRLKNDEVPFITDQHQLSPYQLIDTDSDGRWDDLLIEVSLPARSSKILNIQWHRSQHGEQSGLIAAVRLSLKTKTSVPSPEITKESKARGFKQNIADPYYQMEGPGIENDKVAFRAFFDERNGKDIYGKIVEKPVLSEVGVTGSWHTLQSWGMDIWKVGNSLGAGALAVMEDGHLYRLADADTSKFERLYQGNLSAGFSLKFKNWDIGTARRDGSEKVTIKKGDFFYKDEISVPLDQKQMLVSGMANFGLAKANYTRHNPFFSSLSTYGNLAEGTNTKLGTAILFATADYVDNQTTADTDPVPNTSYVRLKNREDHRYNIYFIACWEKTDPRFATKQKFETYLQETADRLAYPITVKLITKY